mmetsp:Transcript_36697/g.53820  ORF Transcript_36697/g.53820 Transcript_36697/m.53820 type:complete len:84 (-) Transcript_36697:548-799(-)
MPDILFGEERLTDAIPFDTEYPAWGESWNTMEQSEEVEVDADDLTRSDLPTGPASPTNSKGARPTSPSSLQTTLSPSKPKNIL